MNKLNLVLGISLLTLGLTCYSTCLAFRALKEIKGVKGTLNLLSTSKKSDTPFSLSSYPNGCESRL